MGQARRPRRFRQKKLAAGYVRATCGELLLRAQPVLGRAEGFGICPYLFEYGVTKWKGDTPAGGIPRREYRRIDMVSQWSTVVGLCNATEAGRAKSST